MEAAQPDSPAFAAVAARLPASLDLDELARAHGALVRRRRIKSGRDLLHLALAYGGGALSLRGTAAWAEVSGLAQLSDVAVLERLRGSGEFLRAVVGAILAERREAALPRGPARRVRIIDATTISGPGASAEWRLHVDYELAAQRLVGVELSEGRASESFARFCFKAGDIALGDRIYAKARDLQQIIAGGADFVVRVGWNALRLRHVDGSKFDLFAALAKIAPGEQAEATVWIQPGRAKRDLMAVRLVMARHPGGPAIARNRKRARRQSAMHGKQTQPETLVAAEYMLLVTSLDCASFPTADLLTLYRMRWQVELLMKRRKSLMGFDALPAKGAELARSWIYAKLIAALLTEDLVRQVLDSPPSVPSQRQAASTLHLAP
jgi:hypothetical protein